MNKQCALSLGGQIDLPKVAETVIYERKRKKEALMKLHKAHGSFSNIHVLSRYLKSHENSRTVAEMRVIRMHESMRPSVNLRDTKGSLGLVIAMVTRYIMA